MFHGHVYDKVIDLSKRLAEREKEIERLTIDNADLIRQAERIFPLKDSADKLARDNLHLSFENKRYREALEKISKVDLKYDPLIGQIVGSEHYEAAWLDCCEIAKDALGEQ